METPPDILVVNPDDFDEHILVQSDSPPDQVAAVPLHDSKLVQLLINPHMPRGSMAYRIERKWYRISKPTTDPDEIQPPPQPTSVENTGDVIP